MSDNNAITPEVTRGQIMRKEFGAQELQVSAETSMAAAAATATALVKARFVMAMQRPRDWDEVGVRLLRSLERPGFVGKAGEKAQPGEAWYVKPIGAGVEGFTIRFAEEALRCMGNIDIRPSVVYEDNEKRLVDVMVLDLESNIAFTATVVVTKIVERSYLKEGETAIRQRMNSKNKPVFTRIATEDEITSLQNNMVSKIMRTEILRLLPGDIQAACRKRILEIRLGDAATNPDGVKKEVLEAFAKLNVMPVGLKQYLDHELATATPAELADLRELYKEIREGKTTWHAALTAALAERGETPPPADDKKTGLDGVTEKLKAAGAPPAAPIDTVPVATETKPAAEPEKPAAPPEPPPCEHTACPPSRIAKLSIGTSIECPDCHMVFAAPSQREPGSDDGPAPVGPRPVPDKKQRRLEEA